MTDKIIAKDAKQLVDLMFETNIFKEDLTRDNLDSIEVFVSQLLESRFESYKRGEKLLKNLENKNP